MPLERLYDDLMIAGVLLGVGLLLGLADRKNFRPSWLLISAGLVLLYAFIHLAAGTFVPNMPWESRWNWPAKIIATIVFLGISLHPALGLREVGVTLKQDRQGLRAVTPFVLLYAALFIGLALFNPPTNAPLDTIVFQLTMPSFEEELFFRGLFLLTLYKALEGRIKFLGVQWGWGALLASVVFGLAHALKISGGELSFELIYFLATAIPALAGVWVRLRTGSLLIPVLMHSLGNAADHII